MLDALKAFVQSYARPSYADSEARVAMNPRGDLSVCQGMPISGEVVRLGGSFMTVIDTAEAFTYVAAWPTTRAELVLYNGELAGGKSYFLRAAFMVDISSALAAQSKALLGQLIAPPVTAPTDNTSLLIQSRSGKAAYGGKARKAVANTAFAVANKWELLGSVTTPNTTTIGAGLVAPLDGWLLPPGGIFGLAGVASTAAGTAIIGVVWDEMLVPLG